MPNAADLLNELVGKDRLTAEDALSLRASIYPDMRVSTEEAEALFRLNDGAQSVAPEWRSLFLEALTDYVVRQQDPSGYVDEIKAEWLVSRIAKDGRLRSGTELELLIRVLETADSAPPLLSEVALTQVAAHALSPERRQGDGPTLTSEEVGLLRRVLYAFAGAGGAAAVSRREAEVLFALNDAAKGRPNSPEWQALFVGAIGGSLLAAAGYEAVDREEARRREAWLQAPPEGVGRFLSRAFESLLEDPLAGFRKDEDPFAERQTATTLANTAAAPLEEAEVAWLTAQIGRDGGVDANEAALLDFIAQNAEAVHPSFQPLIRGVLDRWTDTAPKARPFGARAVRPT
jgi:hypothetical protein